MAAGLLNEILEVFGKYSLHLAELIERCEIFFAVNIILDSMQYPSQPGPGLLVVQSLQIRH